MFKRILFKEYQEYRSKSQNKDKFDSSVGNKLSLYSEVKNEVSFESYLDLIKNVKTSVRSKYCKSLCIRTLIKLSYHKSSVEAVHSQVIFSFMIIFNCSFLSYLTFILLFSFVIVLVLKSSCRR